MLFFIENRSNENEKLEITHLLVIEEAYIQNDDMENLSTWRNRFTKKVGNKRNSTLNEFIFQKSQLSAQ